VELADHDCERCSGIGSVPGCHACHVMPVDPMRAPFCSSVCEDEHARAVKIAAIRSARHDRRS
jgi:hypothetical protein